MGKNAILLCDLPSATIEHFLPSLISLLAPDPSQPQSAASLSQSPDPMSPVGPGPVHVVPALLSASGRTTPSLTTSGNRDSDGQMRFNCLKMFGDVCLLLLRQPNIYIGAIPSGSMSPLSAHFPSPAPGVGVDSPAFDATTSTRQMNELVISQLFPKVNALLDDKEPIPQV